MANNGLKIAVSIIAVFLLVVHILLPVVQIDAIAIGLFLIALLPWVASFLESAKLPGGWELKFRELQKEVSRIDAEVTPIVDSLTESETETESTIKARGSERALSNEERSVLNALGTGKYPLRSISGLSRSSGLTDKKVQGVLMELKNKGLAVEAHGKKGIRWILTPAGRTLLDT